MVAGYGGTYRATVVDDLDPLHQQRLQVLVPEVYGDAPAWADASLPPHSAWTIPVVGDAVLVSFQHGDTDFPVWEPDQRFDERGDAHAGYVGKYRALVVDNDDPTMQRRLQVTVPEVDASPTWANPLISDDDVDIPQVGSEVWIEFDNADPAHPRWVGIA
jgi:hypothetical protein